MIFTYLFQIISFYFLELDLPNDYEIGIYDPYINSISGIFYGTISISSSNPIVIYFPGCTDCYLQFPATTKSFGPELSFTVFARWEVLNSNSRIFDFGTSATTDAIVL